MSPAALSPFRPLFRHILQRACLPALVVWVGAALPALAHPENAADEAKVHVCPPGPWGDMEYTRIVIEPPDEFLAPDYSAAAARWNFTGYDVPRLAQLWQEAGLSGTQIRTLEDPAIQEPTAEGMILRPDSALVGGLSPEARRIIYNVLALLPDNPLQNEPFRFRAEMVDEWFEDSGVDQAVLTRIRELLYRRGNALNFSDPGLVLPLLPSATERVRLIKTLARKSTLLLKIRIRPDSDIEAIAGYWSRGLRRKDVKPLLQSLSHHRSGMTIDVVHLLPRFARGLLYTYPSPDLPREQRPDCHWTAMNFYNEVPDQRFNDIDYLKEVLLSTFVPVRDGPVFGDLLVMTRADGEVLHSCVYLADDIVFSKNGQSLSVPWILTTLADLQAFYPAQPELEVRVFRRRE